MYICVLQHFKAPNIYSTYICNIGSLCDVQVNYKDVFTGQDFYYSLPLPCLRELNTVSLALSITPFT